MSIFALIAVISPSPCYPYPEDPEAPSEKVVPPARKTVKGRMQTRPGGPFWDVEVEVHEVPDDLPSVPAAAAPLADSDLVLGVVVGGHPMAYPIRYLALFEIIDDRIGDIPVAPSW